MSTTEYKNKILFLVASEEEIASIVENPQYVKSEVKRKIFYNNNNVFIGITGIGKVNAATGFIIFNEFIDPEYVINIGLCGSVSPSINSNDVCLVEQSFQYDVDLTKFNYKRGEIPDLPYCFRTDVKLSNIINTIIFENEKVKNNVSCGTADLFAPNPKIHDNNMKYQIIDMELNGILQAAFFLNKRVCSIKVVSDSVYEETPESKQFLKRIKTLQKKNCFFIDKISSELSMSFD